MQTGKCHDKITSATSNVSGIPTYFNKKIPYKRASLTKQLFGNGNGYKEFFNTTPGCAINECELRTSDCKSPYPVYNASGDWKIATASADYSIYFTQPKTYGKKDDVCYVCRSDYGGEKKVVINGM